MLKHKTNGNRLWEKQFEGIKQIKRGEVFLNRTERSLPYCNDYFKGGISATILNRFFYKLNYNAYARLGIFEYITQQSWKRNLRR